MLKTKDVPEKFSKLWQATEKLLEQAKPEEVAHTKDMINAVLESRKTIKLDLDIFLSLAILHNIERIEVLKKYFKNVSISSKLKNNKIIRLSPAENVAKNLLESINISPMKIEEIIGILKLREKARKTAHTDTKAKNKLYNTDNKKMFYDLHLLSRFNKEEIKDMEKALSDKDEFDKLINSHFNLFFNDKLRMVAQKKFREIEGIKRDPVWCSN